MVFNFEVFPCSNEAMEFIKPGLVGTGETNNEKSNTYYALGRLKIGQSICVPMNVGIKRHNLLMACKSHTKRHEANFRIITHNDLQVFEVVRIGSEKIESKPITQTLLNRSEEGWNTYNVNEGKKGAENFPYYRYVIFDYEKLSDKAKKLVNVDLINSGEYESGYSYQRYPFKYLKIGQAFYILEHEGVMRTTIEGCRKNITLKTGRYFRVIRHKDQQCYEIVRIK